MQTSVIAGQKKASGTVIVSLMIKCTVVLNPLTGCFRYCEIENLMIVQERGTN